MIHRGDMHTNHRYFQKHQNTRHNQTQFQGKKNVLITRSMFQYNFHWHNQPKQLSGYMKKRGGINTLGFKSKYHIVHSTTDPVLCQSRTMVWSSRRTSLLLQEQEREASWHAPNWCDRPAKRHSLLRSKTNTWLGHLRTRIATGLRTRVWNRTGIQCVAGRTANEHSVHGTSQDKWHVATIDVRGVKEIVKNVWTAIERVGWQFVFV